MAAATTPSDTVALASPAAAVTADDILAEMQVKQTRTTRILRYLPFGDSMVDGAKSLITFVDARVPHIRGRPALSELVSNLRPGITVALVSLPLSISLAIAADATPVQGVITAVWAGMVSGFFGGSHYNIVGPTGALSGILSAFSVRYGFGIQPLLAILTGIFSLIVWLLRLERFFVFIPSAVMHGFTLGVAFIISFNQLNFAFGLPRLPRHESFLANVWENVTNLHQTNWFAIIFFIASFGGLTVMQRRMGKVPWSIVLAAVGIIIGLVQEAMGWTVKLATIRSRYGDLEMQLVQASEIFTKGLNVPPTAIADLLVGALSISVVAVLETLISAHIADRMTKTLFNQRQEVLSVALANLASGFTGGIPATAALARTALNIKSGATSRASGILNGLVIMLLSTVLFGLFKYLPLPVVAAILVNVAVRMVEWPEVTLLYKMDKPMFVVAIISGIVCIVYDPTLGIIVGALFGMIRVLMQMRNAHALLRVYQGATCRLNFLFEGVEARRSVKTARAKFTGEPTPEDIANEVAKTATPSAIMDRVEANIDVKEAREREAAEAAARKGAAGAAVFSPKPAAPAALHHAHPLTHSHAHPHRGAGAGAGADAVALEVAPGEGGTAAAAASGGEGDSAARRLRRRERRAARRAAAVARAGRRGSLMVAEVAHLDDDARDVALPLTAVYMLPGYFTFVSAQAHRDRVRALFMEGAASLPGINVVVFSLVETYFADPDALETIGTLQEELRRSGHEVYLLGFHVRVLRSISKAHWFHEVRHFVDYASLVAYMRDQVNERGEYVKPQPPVHDPKAPADHGHGHGHGDAGDHGHGHGGDADGGHGSSGDAAAPLSDVAREAAALAAGAPAPAASATASRSHAANGGGTTLAAVAAAEAWGNADGGGDAWGASTATATGAGGARNRGTGGAASGGGDF